MNGRLAAIWRYPIKGIGREPVATTHVAAGLPLPGDRAWALLHDSAAEDTDDWQPRRNFIVVASGPNLARAKVRSDGPILHLSHPDRPDLSLDPAHDGGALRDWVRPIWPKDRPEPTRLVRAPECGMADNGLAQVSILNLASLAALSDKMGRPIEIERFRGNLILDGLAPWAEFDWIGRTIRIGDIDLAVTERIGRCRATEASPLTGTRDANVPRALEDGWSHCDFGTYASIVTQGQLRVADEVTL